MKSRKFLAAIGLSITVGLGLAGCDDAELGDRTERNIDEAMEGLEKRFEKISEEIEEDAEE